MVGYNPEEYKLSTRDYASVGAICGFVSRVVCQPLDVIKIRFQVQNIMLKFCNVHYY